MYEILFTDKIKSMKLIDLLDVIDEVQAYNGGWEVIFMDKSLVDEDLSRCERLSAIPANYGGILFLHYLYDEKLLIECIREYYGEEVTRSVKSLVEKGVPPIRYLYDFESFFDKYYRSILKEAYFEAYIPLKNELKDEDLAELRELLKQVKDLSIEYEIIKSEIDYLNPNDVRRALDESYYLIDYLKALRRLYEEKGETYTGHLVILKSYIPIALTLKQLEEKIWSISPSFWSYAKEVTMLFYKLI
ncbi:MAG: hypothetical protein DRJ32_05270 [Thermoprotei archaeon]|nr:MAG: hypothetical protein DRJ32_05270 [Thermoprotei archaeon]HDD64171.1 hypothetical protein [Thermoprotei archaeon]